LKFAYSIEICSLNRGFSYVTLKLQDVPHGNQIEYTPKTKALSTEGHSDCTLKVVSSSQITQILSIIEINLLMVIGK